MNRQAIILVVIIAIASFTKVQAQSSKLSDSTYRELKQGVNQFIKTVIVPQYPMAGGARLDTIVLNGKTLEINFNSTFAWLPFREDNTKLFYQKLKDNFGEKYADYDLKIYVHKMLIEELIPNYYRTNKKDIDKTRLADKQTKPPVVRNISCPNTVTKGLNNRNIALWHSHGWYYEQALDRWEWQRARLFQTVEDLGVMSYTVPFIIPMLENAGANVFVPRERDVQTNEVVVDNNSGDATAYIESATNGLWTDCTQPGFAVGTPPYTAGVNPFKLGTCRTIKAEKIATATIDWTPAIPETGEYAVYISYQRNENNVTDAHYTVYHDGGKTEFLINQQIGGATWIYLGTFRFYKGTNPESGRVALTNQSREKNKFVTADAVRFGGGMGNVSRFGKTSGRPRYMEAARYYMQYSGIPDTLVYNLNNDTSDYRDDFQSRGDWVNYLIGAPSGPKRNRQEPGLGIPVDLSLAFHTDAGVTRRDTVIGTLLIYYSLSDNGLFPNGKSRWASRDFADVLQTQIVDDIRQLYNTPWNHRGMWNRDYSEALKPNIPAALIELLSHQNFGDMKFQADPQFRFDVSRMIYKAMLKFIAFQNQTDYVVQPLPVSHFSALLTTPNEVTLSWKPVNDPLEPTALAKQYIVYQRVGDGGFDNGTLVNETQTRITIKTGEIYSFKVSAVNDGGASFPSETLSVCSLNNGSDPVLVINAFDRISAPAILDAGPYTGFMDLWDQGVPYHQAINYTGSQYDFDYKSKWIDDDNPGHGASYADYETKIIPGNTFDFTGVHGKAIVAAGYSFVSSSDEAIADSLVSLKPFKIIDIICGEEKETIVTKNKNNSAYKIFEAGFQNQLSKYVANKGNILITGSYIGTDPFKGKPEKSEDILFVSNTLKYKWRTDHAVKNGDVYCSAENFSITIPAFQFNTGYHAKIYTAEAPDAIEPADKKGEVFLRYTENNTAAGVAYKGDYSVVAIGFPFETIMDEKIRETLMKEMLRFIMVK